MSPLDVVTANVLALLLGQLFEASPHTLYASVLELGIPVIESGNVHPLAAGILAAPVLHVMSFPSPLTADMWSMGVKLMKIAVTKFETDKQSSGPLQLGKENMKLNQLSVVGKIRC